MNMPPRPSQMYLNPDAMELRSQGNHPFQGKMMVQQMNQDVGEHAKSRATQEVPAMAEQVRAAQMQYDSAAAHADAVALSGKHAVLQALKMKGYPMDGMQNIRAAAADLGIA